MTKSKTELDNFTRFVEMCSRKVSVNALCAFKFYCIWHPSCGCTSGVCVLRQEGIPAVTALSVFPLAGQGKGNPLLYYCLENPRGQRSLECYSPCSCKDSDTTEQLSMHAYNGAASSAFLGAHSQKISGFLVKLLTVCAFLASMPFLGEKYDFTYLCF